ncbi:DUF3137 domain-containing protein [Haploplasma axanthum]|uniref:Protein of uncharacterized function (DUF3137) n=1 Tax=Haploplasma axanthum TaxID=29552 RepID=A0A449BDH8_HAPAX|nr:DUF3137 domain-containing protein [Haploplasma axanthum]VEU80511.1 Protein of uncharacterised function (DUF3137) [Haploplasma axanthum]
MSLYTELEEKRVILFEQYKKNRNKSYMFAIIGFVVAAVVVYIMSQTGNYDNSTSVIIILLVIIGITAIPFSIYNKKAKDLKKNFDNTIKNEIVNIVLKETLEDSSYNPQGYVPIETINSAGLVRRPDRFSGEDLITGSYNGVKFQVSDVDLKERHETRTKNGTIVTYRTYFKGRWYVYEFSKNFKQVLKIVERNSGTNTRALKKFETEMLEFNKKFSIYGSDEQFFYYVVNPYLIERLLILENQHRGSIYYCINNNKLHIGINDNSDSLEVDFSVPINEQTLKRFTEDIVLIKTIIEEFRLDDIKFTE